MNTAIILAAGKGARMNAGMNKQFILINGKPLLAHTIEAFQRCSAVDNIILVAGREELELCREKILQPFNLHKVYKLVEGGDVRQQSVYNGIKALDKGCRVVLIHDGARPVISDEIIGKCIEGALEYGAVSAGMPAKETVKILNSNGFVEYTPNRETVWVTQTPQAFKPEIIWNAHETAAAEGVLGTDDAYLVECMGIKVKMVQSSYENIKVTTPEDVILAEIIMNK